MRLFYYQDPEGNFGDDLNIWIWDELIPGWREALPDRLLVGVGTLLNNQLPRGIQKIVCGSGIGYGPLPDAALMAECEFVAVRGPRSTAALGLPAERGILDAAALLPCLDQFRDVVSTNATLLIPHSESLVLHDWERIAEVAEVRLVSPQNDAHAVITAIAGARLVLAESMHAAIIADAFGVPWRAVWIGSQVNIAKWLDWAESLEVTPNVVRLRPPFEDLSLAKRRTLLRMSTAVTRREAPATRRAAGQHKIGRLGRLRRRLDAEWLGRQLAVLAMERGQLSDRTVLARQQAALLAVLEGLRARF